MRVVALILAAVLLGSLPLVPSASAQPRESLETLFTRLPWTWAAGAAVSTGNAVYLIGGTRNGVFTDRIERFDPSTGTFYGEAARLPGARLGASAVWTGSEILIFGGETPGGDDYNDILRFNPSNGTLWRGANLTSPRSFAPAIFDGRYAYIFGGHSALHGNPTDILRYDPETDTVHVLSASLFPFSTYQETTWDGRRAAIFDRFGGRTVSFNATTGEIAEQSPIPHLPPTQEASAVQIGEYTYLFGGWDDSTGTLVDRILRVRTETGDFALVAANLSQPEAFTAAALVGDRAYIFGGWNGTNSSGVIRVFRSVETTNVSPVVGVLVIATAAGVGVAACAAYALHRRGRGKGDAETGREDPKPPSGGMR